MAIDATHGLSEGQLGFCNRCTAQTTVRLLQPSDLTLLNPTDLRERAWLCRGCGYFVCGSCVSCMGVPTPKHDGCGGKMTLPLAQAGHMYSPQDFVEALLAPIADSGQLERSSLPEAWNALLRAGTTVAAVVIDDRPVLLAAPEPRYCYMPRDIAGVPTIEIHAEEPSPLIQVSWWGNGTTYYAHVITSGFSPSPGTLFGAFWNRLKASRKAELIFNGDRADFSKEARLSSKPNQSNQLLESLFRQLGGSIRRS